MVDGSANGDTKRIPKMLPTPGGSVYVKPQTWMLEGSFSDHDGICHAGEYVWSHEGSCHQTHSAAGAVILAIYRKPNIFQHGAGYDRNSSKSNG